MLQSCRCNLHYQNSSSVQNFSVSIPYPAIFGYLIPILVGILGANAQGTTKPLFETHRENMWAFLIATIAYCIALAADKVKSRRHLENHSQLSSVLGVTSGSLASVSLVSTFLPSSIAYIILYVAWSCAAIIIVVYQYGRLFVNACRPVRDEILKPFFSDVWNWFQAKNNISSTEQQQRAPV